MFDPADKVLEQPASPEDIAVAAARLRPAAEPDPIVEHPTTVRYRVAAWLVLASALAYLTRNSIGVAESRIRADLGLTLSQSGWFMGAFFWTYALFQIPTGALAHKYGTRLSLTLFAVAWSAAIFATGVSPVFWVLVLAQLVMGIAQAGYFPASINSIKDWMPMSQRSLGGGLLGLGMQVGAIAASVLTGKLLEHHSWRWVFVLFSLPSLLWALAFYIRFRDKPEQAPQANNAERALIVSGRPIEQQAASQDNAGPTDWGAMLRHRGLWLLCGQQICRAAGYMFFASWFPTFLQQTRGVSIAQSGYMQGVIFAGSMLGSLLGGLLTDWVWRRTGNIVLSRSGVGAASLGICGLLILGSWAVDDAHVALGLLALGVLFASIAGPAMMAAVIDISGARAAQVLGAVNMAGNFAVAICPILVGKLFEQTKQIANWNLVLILFAAIYVLGALCWVFVNPRIGIFKVRPSAD